MNHLLVPTDFSETADLAIDFAFRLAKRTSAKLTLLNSFEVKDTVYSNYLGVNREFNASVLHDTKEKLEAIKKKLGNEVDITTEVSADSLLDSLKKTVAEKKVDLIIMGTLGASGIKSKLYGSHTSAVIGKTKVPVLVIPHQYKWQKPEKFLLSTRKFEKEKHILNPLFDLAEIFNAEVTAMVFTNTDRENADIYLENQHSLEEYASFLKKEYNSVPVHAVHLRGEDYAASLQDFTDKNKIDVLSLITYQNNFWKSLFNPSVTKQMSFHTQIPMLAIPAGAEKRNSE